MRRFRQGHGPPEMIRPAALGERERAGGPAKGRLCVANHAASNKCIHPPADEISWVEVSHVW